MMDINFISSFSAFPTLSHGFFPFEVRVFIGNPSKSINGSITTKGKTLSSLFFIIWDYFLDLG